jgi:hypothetical protein
MQDDSERDLRGWEIVLPGELPDSDVREDAEHWAAVYEELIGFLLGSHARAGTLARYHRRLTFWRQRLDQLAGGPSPETGR